MDAHHTVKGLAEKGPPDKLRRRCALIERDKHTKCSGSVPGAIAPLPVYALAQHVDTVAVAGRIEIVPASFTDSVQGDSEPGAFDFREPVNWN